jgi:ubiquinone/menaquinone biosynthesis C-methylase UbiE
MLNTFKQADHPMLPKPTANEAAAQEFVKSLRAFIQSSLLPGLRPVLEKRAAPRYKAATGKAPETRHEIREAMKADPYFQTYASTNRIAQELLWTSVQTSIERQLPELKATADALPKGLGSCRTDPEFEPPRYVTALDIHCMPGGYAPDYGDYSFAAGALYDRGVYLYGLGYSGPYSDDKGRSVCNYVRRNLDGFAPKRILDMGCTAGQSTVPYKELFPDAEIYAIDVSAAQISYAHLRAVALGHGIHFSQQNAERTDFEDESFDLVVSHILLHETSGKAIGRIFDECYRLLKPGGYMIHADLPPFGKMDEFTKFILDNETYYNNEPFWGAMRELDQIELAVKAGFSREAVFFDTAPMAIREVAGAAGYAEKDVKAVAERKFKAGEYAPGAGWEVLVARK